MKEKKTKGDYSSSWESIGKIWNVICYIRSLQSPCHQSCLNHRETHQYSVGLTVFHGPRNFKPRNRSCLFRGILILSQNFMKFCRIWEMTGD